jgi:Sel1 repeat
MSVLNSLRSDASSSDVPPLAAKDPPGGERFQIPFATLRHLPLEPAKVPRKWLLGSIIFSLYIGAAISAPIIWSMVAKTSGHQTAQVKSTLSSNAAAPSVVPLVDDGRVNDGLAKKAKEPQPRAEASPQSPSTSMEKTAHLTADDRSAQTTQPPAQIPPKSAAQHDSSQTVSSSPQTASSILVLDNDEITALLKRGKTYIANGDLASARLLLSRAAEAGSAEAATELAATFDPLVLRQRGVIGVEPDIARARKWYQRAAELGSTLASQQLAKLNAMR